MSSIFSPKQVKTTTRVTVEITCHESQVKKAEEALKTIAAKLSPEELDVLRKVCEKPVVKAMALSQAKKFV